MWLWWFGFDRWLLFSLWFMVMEGSGRLLVCWFLGDMLVVAAGCCGFVGTLGLG